MFQRVETRARAIAGALLIGAAALAGCGTEVASTGGHAQAQDRVGEARALVDRGATLLDVRSPGEWEAGHLEGATLIPVQELSGRLSEVPRDRPVVVYCASGRRSDAAASMMRGAGYEVFDLGGMPSTASWSR